MSKSILIVLIVVFCNGSLISQNKFFSNLYFPNSYGLCMPFNYNYLRNSAVLSNEFEYRFENKTPIFIRFSIDNSTYQYEIPINNRTNVLKSELKANSYYFGFGIKKKFEKYRFTGQLQIGELEFKYPIINTLNNNIEVDFLKDNCVGFKTCLGVEYYIFDDFAILFEAYYCISPSSSIFCKSTYQTVGIKFGITTTLF
jgi:hypothetical protein